MCAIFAMSASVSSRWTRSMSVPSLRASMKSVCLRVATSRNHRHLLAAALFFDEEPKADRNLRE